jgi:hypothetical protein
MFYRVLVKLLIRPFLWAHSKKKQTILTRLIRAAWHAL